MVTNPVHVAHWGTFAITPEVAETVAIVQVKTRVRNEGKGAVRCALATSILDGEGKTVRTADASQSITASGEYEFVQQLRVERPNLWSPDNPYLYKVRSTLREPDQVVDECDTPLGIRHVEFEADNGFLFNGKR